MNPAPPVTTILIGRPAGSGAKACRPGRPSASPTVGAQPSSRLGPLDGAAGAVGVAAGRRAVLDGDLDAEGLGRQLQQLLHRHLGAAGYVEDRAQFEVGLGGGEGGGHHVVDEGEVAHRRAVAVEREPGAVEAGLEDPVDGHVGPLPGPVDGEVAQGDGGHAPVGGVEPAQVLAGQLSHAVGEVGRREVVLAGRVALRPARRPTGSARRRAGGSGPGCTLRSSRWVRGRCGWRTPRTPRPTRAAPRPGPRGGKQRRRPRAARPDRPRREVGLDQLERSGLARAGWPACAAGS